MNYEDRPVTSNSMAESQITDVASAEVAAGDVAAPKVGKLVKDKGDRIDWMGSIPFILMHLVCLLVFVVGWSPFAVGTAIVLYVVRMHAITGWYHRYFSHRSFKTSRAMQFAMAWLGTSCVQRGPIWWASCHRHHHQYSDRPEDIHSPKQHGFWWSHCGWFLTKEIGNTDLKKISDLAKYPELRFLDRQYLVPPIILAVGIWLLGWGLETWAPSLGTGRWQMLIWGFFVSTIFLAHGTYTINSLTHLWGKPRFDAGDDSRNHWFLAIITLGEGWHNNHHYYMHSTRQGFYWWEYDISYYILKGMSLVGLVWDLKPVPERILKEGRDLDAAK